MSGFELVASRQRATAICLVANTELGKSDLIRRSVKEWIEGGDDLVPDEIKDLLYHSVNPKIFKMLSRRIVERYKDGTLSIHLHIRKVGKQMDGQTYGEICSIAQVLVSQDHVDMHDTTPLPLQIGVVGDNGGDVETLVLVDVMELVENSERAIPCCVRLQSLDQCNRVCADAAQTLRLNLVGKISLVSRDRKLIACTRNIGGIGDHELPHKVVKDGAHVEQKISHDRTNLGRSFGLQADSQTKVLAIKVYHGDDFAMPARDSPDHLEYLVQMLLRPGEFEPYPA
jgi:hypothetical protein